MTGPRNSLESLSRLTAIWLVILGLWFSLSFIGGMDFLITPWQIKHGVWFWISFSLLVQVFAAALVCWNKLSWSPFFVLSLTGTWLVIQYSAHWSGFINPPDSAAIEKYYDHFETWYLIPRISDRIVPDGYHTILTVLLLICFILGIRALILRLRSWKK